MSLADALIATGVFRVKHVRLYLRTKPPKTPTFNSQLPNAWELEIGCWEFAKHLQPRLTRTERRSGTTSFYEQYEMPLLRRDQLCAQSNLPAMRQRIADRDGRRSPVLDPRCPCGRDSGGPRLRPLGAVESRRHGDDPDQLLHLSDRQL